MSEAPEVAAATRGRKRSKEVAQDGRLLSDRTRDTLERGEKTMVYIPESEDPKAPRVVVLATINGATWFGIRGEEKEVPLEVARIAHAAKIISGPPPKGAFNKPQPSGVVRPLALNTWDRSRQTGANQSILLP